MSPTARTLAHLRRQGYLPWVVETWVPVANVRRDLWGFGDVLEMKEGSPLLIVQTTPAAHVAARLAKATRSPSLRTWLACSGLFEIHGWAKSHDGRWRVRVPKVSPDSLEGIEVQALPLTGEREKVSGKPN